MKYYQFQNNGFQGAPPPESFVTWKYKRSKERYKNVLKDIKNIKKYEEKNQFQNKSSVTTKHFLSLR